MNYIVTYSLWYNRCCINQQTKKRTNIIQSQVQLEITALNEWQTEKQNTNNTLFSFTPPLYFSFIIIIFLCANINYIFVTLIIINIYFNQAVSIVCVCLYKFFVCLFPCQVIYLLIINNILLLNTFYRIIFLHTLLHAVMYIRNVSINQSPCISLLLLLLKRADGSKNEYVKGKEIRNRRNIIIIIWTLATLTVILRYISIFPD